MPQYINQVIYGVLGLVNLIKGSNWHVTPFNLAKSNVDLMLFRELSR